ncbi:MAG: head fiber protein [Bacteriophage sp.]|nr:MAG: head fiber protein [Bacteriophage sp.]
MRQLGTFNTISQSRSGFGGNFPVWSRVRELYQGGGMIDVAGMGLKPGDIIHAGTMVKFNGAGKQVEVITADGATGVKAVVTLTITEKASGNGDLSIVLGGKSYSVAVTSASESTPELVATKIEGAKSSFAEWDVKRSGATVTFTQKTAAQLYAYMFIPGNTGVTGDIEETVKGVPAGGKLTDVNGLVFEDVCIPEGCILATCAVVRAGRIYADRVFGGGIPKSVEAQLPMIEFVRESDE